MPSGAVLDRVLLVGGALVLLLGIVLLVDHLRDDETAQVVAEDAAEADEADAPAQTPPPTPSTSASAAPEPTATPTPASTPAATPTPTGTPTESAEEFFELWLAGLTSGDTGPLLARLHPVVIGAYGEEQCATYLDGVTNPDLDATVVGEEPLPDYRLTVDGLDLAVDEPTTRVTLDRRDDADGERYEAAATLAEMPDGTRAWFTDCGTPQ